MFYPSISMIKWMYKKGGESGKGHGNHVDSTSPPNYIHVWKSFVPMWIGFSLSHRERINKQKCFSKRRKIIAKLYTFNCSTITQANLHQAKKHILVIKKKKSNLGNHPKLPSKESFLPKFKLCKHILWLSPTGNHGRCLRPKHEKAF